MEAETATTEAEMTEVFIAQLGASADAVGPIWSLQQE